MVPTDVPARATPRVVCAWCQILIRAGSTVRVSHGICQPCAAAMRNDLAVIDPANPPVPWHPTVPIPPALN